MVREWQGDCGEGSETMRALRTALTLLLLTGLVLECESAAKESGNTEEADDDEDSDEAPFMIVIEHVSDGKEVEGGAGGWRCAGSLVSRRTGVTSAECARARPEMSARWALAAATAAGQASRRDGARRVSRIATAGTAQPVFLAGEWNNALLDLAVLELESPFDADARARPILMATTPHECSENSVCHVVRALAGRTAGTSRLRIVDASLGGEAPCVQSVHQWSSLRERALCLTGPELCDSEWGAGVVCGGKLCGVLSRSAGTGGSDSSRHCGTTHAAQSVARWRRFLHCAHTLRSCGRGACAEVCSEQRLFDDGGDASSESTTPAPATRSPASPLDERELELDVGREHDEHDEHTKPHMHAVNLDLAHLAPGTHTPQLANRTRVVPPARTPPYSAEYPQQSSLALLPGLARAAIGRPPTRSTWPTAARRAHSPTHVPPTPPPLPPTPPAPPLSADGPRPPVRPPPVTAQTEDDAAGAPSSFLSTRRPSSPATPALLPPLTPSTSPSSVRPTPLFEPNRPDFRAGEYGDNAAEYAMPADDGFPFRGSSGGHAANDTHTANDTQTATETQATTETQAANETQATSATQELLTTQSEAATESTQAYRALGDYSVQSPNRPPYDNSALDDEGETPVRLKVHNAAASAVQARSCGSLLTVISYLLLSR